MSIVIETYKDGTGKTAIIEKKKESRLFYVYITFNYNGIVMTEYKNNFMTIQNARRAVKRNLPGAIKEKTEDKKNNGKCDV